MNMIAPDAVRYRAPCLSAEHAALARALSRCRGVRESDGFDLQVVAPPEHLADPVAFDLCVGGAAGRLTLPGRLLHDVLAHLDPAAPMAAPDVAALLLELAVEPFLLRLESGCPALSVSLDAGGTDWDDTSLALGLAIRHGALAGTLRLDLDTVAARQVAAALARLPDRVEGTPDLPVSLHLRLCCAIVTVADIDAARPGDVIPVDTLADGDILVVLAERFVWRAYCEGARLSLASHRRRACEIGLERWMMDDAIADDAASLDELPVRLAFELGRLELPLAELTTLGPGHVFELARDEAQPVDILANGRRIGRGRIVSVAGTIGVQIVRLGRE